MAGDQQRPPLIGLYGRVPHGLLAVPEHAFQCSPGVPGARLLTDLQSGSLDQLIVHAPPSTLERRHVVALALQALRPGAPLTVFAANRKGGTRLAKELAGFGCAASTSPKRHHQIVDTIRAGEVCGIEQAVAQGEARFIAALGLFSQPGLFSWDRADPGSLLLLRHLPPLTGRGADLGCGYGLLAHHLRETANATELFLVDIDKRALDVAGRNVCGDGVTTIWADVRTAVNLPQHLDFIVMNPPFHDGGKEDRGLGDAFIRRAAQMLRPDGQLWLTANRHLPYEPVLAAHFSTRALVEQAGGYKIYCAIK